jgi:hypothetical protein
MLCVALCTGLWSYQVSMKIISIIVQCTNGSLQMCMLCPVNVSTVLAHAGTILKLLTSQSGPQEHVQLRSYRYPFQGQVLQDLHRLQQVKHRNTCHCVDVGTMGAGELLVKTEKF